MTADNYAAITQPRRRLMIFSRIRNSKAAAAAAIFAAALLTVNLLTPADGHGVMIQPRSHNWVAYLEQNFGYAHGLSMGGANVVSDGGKLRYPDGRRGLCGDVWNETKWNAPGPIQVTYNPGQVINVDVLITVNHMGRMTMQVCNLRERPGQPGKCLSLYLKAPGHNSTKSWYLPGIKDWGGGNWGGDGPRYGELLA